MELKSSVVGVTNNPGAGNGNALQTLVFTLAIASGGNSIDFTEPTGNAGGIATGSNSITISYVDINKRVDNLYWQKTAVGQDNGNNLLEPNEQFQITLNLQALGGAIIANTTFTIEIKTAKGAVMSFERTMPGYVNLNNDLH
jgi:archaellin